MKDGLLPKPCRNAMKANASFRRSFDHVVCFSTSHSHQRCRRPLRIAIRRQPDPEGFMQSFATLRSSSILRTPALLVVAALLLVPAIARAGGNGNNGGGSNSVNR